MIPYKDDFLALIQIICLLSPGDKSVFWVLKKFSIPFKVEDEAE